MSSQLVPCKTCKKEVSINAKVCPHCGEKEPAVTTLSKFLGLMFVFLILWLVAFVVSDDKVKSKIVTKTEYGDKWAFKQDKAVLKCYVDGDIKSPIVELDGIPYGLTGFADNKYGQSDINAINKYWLDNPTYKGLKVDIGTFQKEALKLCD